MSIARNCARLRTRFSVPSTLLLAATLSLQVSGAEDPGTPYYEQMIRLLKNSTDVIPPDPPVFRVRAMYNREAIIPPQCYTRTEGEFNPCYVCHQNGTRQQENRMNDRHLQTAYSFSDLGMTNLWKNLFTDRGDRIAAISDQEIGEWVAQDNYTELPVRLRAADFKGWIPDLDNLSENADAFDAQGFALDGSHWVAFNYKPLPSVFWPTNGSFDDVMIRLHEDFRMTPEGEYSRDIYLTNLSIVEANIKGLARITVPPIDENSVGKDLNGDGEFGNITEINRIDGYVGKAKNHFFPRGLYPLGTEFMHTLRYLAERNGEVVPAPRMKEVRYMRKDYVLPQYALDEEYRKEGYDKDMGVLPGYIYRDDRGLDNEMGWVVQGFIENADGRLRAGTYEETMFCMGCHTSIGATIDKTFSFARKIDGAAGWGYIDLKGMPDAPSAGESRGEIATYLQRAGTSEFRNNDEMRERWYGDNGKPDFEKIAKADVHQLITPSVQRARALNKAYKTIVEEQSYIYGRDAVISPPRNVYERVDNQETPTLPEEFTYDWTILLDWPAAMSSGAMVQSK